MRLLGSYSPALKKRPRHGGTHPLFSAVKTAQTCWPLEALAIFKSGVRSVGRRNRTISRPTAAPEPIRAYAQAVADRMAAEGPVASESDVAKWLACLAGMQILSTLPAGRL